MLQILCIIRYKIKQREKNVARYIYVLFLAEYSE